MVVRGGRRKGKREREMEKTMITTIPELRKELKKIGFNVKIKTLSWGPHADYVDSDGVSCPSIYGSDEARSHWKPLHDFLNEHADELRSIKEEHNVYGLLK